MNTAPIIIAIDGPSASGKSTNARLIARKLGYTYVDTGAMYRTLAWHCLQRGVPVREESAVAQVCREWRAELVCVEGHVRLLVDGYFPEAEIRTAEVSAAVPHVAAVPEVRHWMKLHQRDCARFGHLVMEGRDIGSNIFPETPCKFYLDAAPAERQRRREADGVQENLAARDQKDSQRATAPLKIAEGARIIDNSGETPEQTSARIIAQIQHTLAGR